MDEEVPINPSSVILIRMLFFVVIGLSVFTLHLNSSQMTIRPVGVENQSMPTASPSLSLEEETPDANPAAVPKISRHKKTEFFFHPIILKASNRHQVDPALVKAIIMAESGYNPRAISKRGAKGLMQLMPGTAEALGVEDSFNPEQNIRGGVRYFKQLVNQFGGDLKLALAAYNAGSSKVREYQGIPPFKSTRSYIKKVFEYYHLYKSRPENNTDKV